MTRHTPGPRARSRLAAAPTAVAAAVALAGTAAVLAPSTAFAAGSDEILSYGAANPNGTDVSTADSLGGGLESGTTATLEFTSNGSPVTITCTEVTVVVKIVTNPKPPGTVAFAIEELTFGGCSISGLSGVTISGITLKSGTTGSGSITDGAPPKVTITNINEAITLKTGLGNVVCDFGTTSAIPSIVGIITNPGSGGTGGKVAFTDDPVGLISGSSVCGASGSTGTFDMTLGQIDDGTAPVYVN